MLKDLEVTLKLKVKVTPELIETLNSDQLKDMIYQLLAIQGAEVENKVESDSNIPKQEDNGLNLLKTSQIIEDIPKTEYKQPIIENVVNAEINMAGRKISDFITNKKGELILMSKIADEYKAGISMPILCRKYNINNTTLYTRLDRLKLIVKKKLK
jgi:hypothetical protein